MTTLSSDDDDWFYDSISRYKHLYMYDLQYPVTALDWINTNYVCVATRGRSRHEITELSLPDKLCTLEDLALSKNRDFQVVTGGFSSSQINAVKHMPDTRLICTSSVNNHGHLEIWKLGSQETDLIKLETRLNNRKPKGACSSITELKKSHVIFGSHGDNLCYTDVMSQSILQDTTGFTCEGRLSCIRNLGELVVCGCFTSGQLLIWDTREKTPVLQETECDKSVQWTMDCCETDMVQLSSGGDIQFRDYRKPKTCNMTLSNSIGFTSKDLEYLKICLKKQNGSLQEYSVSGFDGNVYLFSSDSTSPVFVHEGHVKNGSNDLSKVKVVTHSWHPTENVVLSAATDGSLHAWQQTS